MDVAFAPRNSRVSCPSQKMVLNYVFSNSFEPVSYLCTVVSNEFTIEFNANLAKA